jgi:hypothetical protein
MRNGQRGRYTLEFKKEAVHSPGHWHGYPIGWEEVPPKIRNGWRKEGKVTRKQIRDSWEEAKLSSDE